MNVFSTVGQEFISYLGANGRGKKLSTSIAIAKCIADSLILPTSELENVDISYKSMCAIDANSKISPINEVVLLDIECISEYILKFWKVRYYTMFPRYPMSGYDKSKAILSLFGLDYAIDKNTIEIITNEFIEVAKIYNTLHLVLISE